MPMAPSDIAFQHLGARRALAYLWHELLCSEAMLDRTAWQSGGLYHKRSFVVRPDRQFSGGARGASSLSRSRTRLFGRLYMGRGSH